MERALDELAARGIDLAIVERLGHFLEQAPDPEVARIRPLALAQRWGVDGDSLVAACLHGAREGLLVLLWDLLCPICRISSEIKDTLRAIADHGHCPACNLDYPLDFASSVELVFRVHPEIRSVDLGTYCIGGPAHFPHVLAQVRVAGGERIELALELPEGSYRVRGPATAVVGRFSGAGGRSHSPLGDQPCHRPGARSRSIAPGWPPGHHVLERA